MMLVCSIIFTFQSDSIYLYSSSVNRFLSLSLQCNQELDGNKYCHRALFLLSICRIMEFPVWLHSLTGGG